MKKSILSMMLIGMMMTCTTIASAQSHNGRHGDRDFGPRMEDRYDRHDGWRHDDRHDFYRGHDIRPVEHRGDLGYEPDPRYYGPGPRHHGPEPRPGYYDNDCSDIVAGVAAAAVIGGIISCIVH